jgi:hypothetical protein
MSHYNRHSGVANSSHFNPNSQHSKRYSNAGPGKRASQVQSQLRPVALKNGDDKMAKIGGLYSNANADLMLYEVCVLY